MAVSHVSEYRSVRVLQPGARTERENSFVQALVSLKSSWSAVVLFPGVTDRKVPSLCHPDLPIIFAFPLLLP